jgi:hypothetical protein
VKKALSSSYATRPERDFSRFRPEQSNDKANRSDENLKTTINLADRRFVCQ